MIEQQYIDLFNQFRSDIDKNSSNTMNAVRNNALQIFEKEGFPTNKQEEYLHTSVDRAFDCDLGLNIRNITIPANPYDAFKCDVPNLQTYLHFMINDRYYDKHDQKQILTNGVFVGSMREFDKIHPNLFQQHYNKIANEPNNGLTAYNTMFAQDGFVIYVPDNVTVEKPIQLVNILRGRVALNANRRILVIVGDNASVKLLACDHSVDDVPFVVTQVVEIFAGKNANVDFYELEENSTKVNRFSSLFSRQQTNSNVVSVAITLHNGRTRNNYKFELADQFAQAHAGGLAICDKEQHIDNFAFLDHASPDCISNELFKYVLQQKACGVFCGKILVEKDAQHTQAYQNNRNLSMSDSARMFSKPQLEIYADDVKCSHGLTTGRLDEDALFYLRARGIDKEEAQLLLMLAFTKDVVDMINIQSLRDRLETLINKRFRGELQRCGGCNECRL